LITDLECAKLASLVMMHPALFSHPLSAGLAIKV